MRISTGIGAGLFLAASLKFALASGLPDGTYACTIDGAFIGDIRIDGGTFSGPAFDGNYEASYPVEVTDAGTVSWGGPLGGLEADGDRVVSTVLTGDSDSPGFDITVQNSSGNFQTVSCGPQ